MSIKDQATLTKLIVWVCAATFVAGLIMIVVGCVIPADNLTVKTKNLSGAVSTLIVVGLFLTVVPIVMVFVGPALANRISLKK